MASDSLTTPPIPIYGVCPVCGAHVPRVHQFIKERWCVCDVCELRWRHESSVPITADDWFALSNMERAAYHCLWDELSQYRRHDPDHAT
jgi:hypothetical protein